MEENHIRINKVLRELNISLERAVDFLNSKGISIEASPNTKISDNIYQILCSQFAGDKKHKPKVVLKIENELGIEINLTQNEALIDSEKRNTYQLNNKNKVIGLNLRGNQIENISFIEDFVDLVFLNLKSNQITEISSIKKCKKLTTLNLAHNQIVDVSALKDLNELTDLDLSWNQIIDIQSLQNLQNLTYLDLAENHILNVSALKDLTELGNLYLENNRITDVDPLKNLNRLGYLYLSENRISNILPLIELNQLNNVSLYGNLALEEIIPKEVLESDWNAIKEYVKNQENDKLIVFKDVKILLLGNPNIGKSQLLEYLETNKYPTKEKITQGIVYKKIIKDNINLHIWDFGGQEYFHATHKLFFSPNALNLVLWSRENVQRDLANPEACFNLDYWLRTIEQLNKQKNTETILLENKIDLNEFISTPVDYKCFSEIYPTLKINYSSISLQQLKRTEGLKELLLERANTLTNDYPKYYQQILNQVENKNVATISQIKIQGISTEDISSAFQVLHNMGIVLYFETILPHKVFPKPQLLLDLLYEKVLGVDKRDNVKTSEIKEAIKGNLLKLSADDVLNLLSYFDLIFMIPTEIDTYFIPQYLHAPPTLIDFFEKHQFSFVNIKILGDNYLMSIIMLKIFSKYGKDVKGKETKEYLFWKDGIVIEKDNAIVMLKFKRELQTIEFYTYNAFSNFELQLEIVEFILNLPHEEDKNNPSISRVLEKEFFLSNRLENVKEALGQTIPKSRKYSFNDEINFESNYMSVYVSNEGDCFVKWDQLNDNLKNGIYSIVVKNRNDIEKKVSIFNYNRYLPQNNKKGMKKMFISYSKDDLELVNSYIKSLQPLILEGTLSEVWYCTYLSPGDEVHEKIKTKMENADIICFMCSNNFYATKYIIENELKPTLKKKIDGGSQLILPIIIDRCKWISDNQEINLGKFAGFPYRGKPVSDFNNWNDAWYVMNWFLEQVIKEDKQPEYDRYFDGVEDLPSEIKDLLKRQINEKLDRK